MRAEWPPFPALPGIWLALLFFDEKYMTDQIFLDWYMKGPTFSDIPVYAHIFHSDILRLLVLLVINELTALFV